MAEKKKGRGTRAPRPKSVPRKKARWIVAGPYFADRWWFVENDNAFVPELTRTWFATRTEARAFAAKKNGKQKARHTVRRQRPSVKRGEA